MLIIEPKNSAISIGMSPMFDPRPDWNRSGLRLAAQMSAWRVSAQYPGPGGIGASYSGSGWNEIGLSARSFANTASRTSSGCCQSSGSDSLISSTGRSLKSVMPEVCQPSVAGFNPSG